mmetsp:Transcript_38351/g.105652  ORF Transcript_38351/g.105652 Transcript_38351/m.105652 type:complete len:239 (+) Transcript_38351:94-810(+)
MPGATGPSGGTLPILSARTSAAPSTIYRLLFFFASAVRGSHLRIPACLRCAGLNGGAIVVGVLQVGVPDNAPFAAILASAYSGKQGLELRSELSVPCSVVRPKRYDFCTRLLEFVPQAGCFVVPALALLGKFARAFSSWRGNGEDLWLGATSALRKVHTVVEAVSELPRELKNMSKVHAGRALPTPFLRCGRVLGLGEGLAKLLVLLAELRHCGHQVLRVCHLRLRWRRRARRRSAAT